MPYPDGPKVKATTVEEFLRRGGGHEDPPPEPGAVEKKIRSWAQKLIRREKKTLNEAVEVTPRIYLENKHKVRELNEQFRKVSDPAFEGTIEAVKVLWRYGFGLREAQPS